MQKNKDIVMFSPCIYNLWLDGSSVNGTTARLTRKSFSSNCAFRSHRQLMYIMHNEKRK